MKISSRRGGLTDKAAPADSAVSHSVKPNNQKIEGTASKHFYFGQGGPMLEGGMPKGRPKSAPPVIAGSTRPEDSKAGRSAHNNVAVLEKHQLCESGPQRRSGRVGCPTGRNKTA